MKPQAQQWLWISAATLLACYVFVFKILRKLNGWYYDLKIGKTEYPLPPGDMGWPLIGNLVSFMKSFLSGRPDTFIDKIVSKFGRTGIYKTHLFGTPCILICVPEMARRVITDDDRFKISYPKANSALARSRLLGEVSSAEHKRIRRLVTAPIIGHNALAMYIERIEDIVITSLEEMASSKHPVELLQETKEVSMKVIIHIFVGSCTEHAIKKIRDLFTEMHSAFYGFPVNLPGFAYHKALKTREKLIKIVESLVEERRKTMKNDQTQSKKDLLDILLEIEGENGNKLEAVDIVELLILFLFAGHQSTATAMMWAVIYLTQNPHLLQKAKEEQEEILKARPPSQDRLNLKEIKQMAYLSQVIDETLRLANIGFAVFREATTDVNMNGYVIPKGWRVLCWQRAIHMDAELYLNSREFNPSRWDDYNGKAGTFIPFGAGSRLCPGKDLVKLEMSIFLHYLLLSYKVERVNPDAPLTSLPTTKPKDNCVAKVTKISCA